MKKDNKSVKATPTIGDLKPRKDAKGGGKHSATNTGIGSAKVTGVHSAGGDSGI